MPKLRPTGRIKPKYSPTPSASERAFHITMCGFHCIACERAGGLFHHLMSDAPGKRWRRDHEFGLPLCNDCHTALHMHGNEKAWCAGYGFDPAERAGYYRERYMKHD